jgi:ribosomal protein L11 methyltransferase
LTVVLTVPVQDAEVASDALWNLGAAAVEERTLGDVVELRVALGERRSILRRRLAHLRWPWRFEKVDLSVAERWRNFAEPTYVDDRIVVVPAWLPAAELRGQDIVLTIEPGPTFGMGNHPTTVACLRALRAEIQPGDTVLDVGTGSGVLAVAAIALGAARAHGTDLVPASLDIVAANARRNGVADRVTVGLEPLSEISEPTDVVVANILAPALRELAADLVRLTGRTLIVSGVLNGRYADVVDCMHPLVLRDKVVLDGWVALILGR